MAPKSRISPGVKEAPWKTDSSARPFVGEKGHRKIPAVHHEPVEGGHYKGGVRPDYITSNAKHYGPVDMTWALQQR